MKQLLISALLFTCMANAQQLEKFSIDSGGASVLVSGIQLIYTIGEVNVQELAAANNTISEGFITTDLETVLAVENHQIAGLVLYPNPTPEVLHINAQEQIIKVTIYNQLGQIIKTIKPLATNFKLDVTNLSTGVYLIRIVSNRSSSTKRIVKM